MDKGATAIEARFDGQSLLRTSDDTLKPTDLAIAYKQLYEGEWGWRDLKGRSGSDRSSTFGEDLIRAHVQLCWLALLLIRTVEHTFGDYLAQRQERARAPHLVTLDTAEGRVPQRSAPTPRQREIL